jgi:hypothetical protein
VKTKNKYKYKVSIMGGGILPVAIKNDKVYFLFGKENELDDTDGLILVVDTRKAKRILTRL